ncbi:hypothetical protein [uncultured Serinicoccus sp.]|nr:hypothetical protein [uncultured Serinicoccus sp.]
MSLLPAPGDRLDELLAYVPARLRDAEIRRGSRMAEIRRELPDTTEG